MLSRRNIAVAVAVEVRPSARKVREMSLPHAGAIVMEGRGRTSAHYSQSLTGDWPDTPETGRNLWPARIRCLCSDISQANHLPDLIWRRLCNGFAAPRCSSTAQQIPVRSRGMYSFNVTTSPTCASAERNNCRSQAATTSLVSRPMPATRALIPWFQGHAAHGTTGSPERTSGVSARRMTACAIQFPVSLLLMTLNCPAECSTMNTSPCSHPRVGAE
jgi:hypothetical protein